MTKHDTPDSAREVAPPYVFVEDRPLVSMDTVRALVGSGQFEHLLRDPL